jgi:hypothetical protein
VPFTISHTIAAFPIKRFLPRLPLDALMIGATGPDLEYLYNLRVHGKYWHTLEGFLIGAVPVCLVLVFLWRKAVYQALLALLPNLRETGKVPSRLRAPIAHTVIAVIIGGFTHLLWDSFTHYNGWGVHQFPHLLVPFLASRPLYGWLQDLSSLAGVIVLGVRLKEVWQLHKASLTSRDRTRLFSLMAVISVLSIIGGVVNAMRWDHERTGVVIGQFAIGGMATFVMICALFSAMILAVRWWIYRRRIPANEAA